MFDGKVKVSRSYGSSRRSTDSASRSHGNFLNQARQEREVRALEKLRQRSAIRIQANFRGHRASKALLQSLRQEFDSSLQNITKMKTLLSAAGKTFIVPVTVMIKLLRMFSLFFNLLLDSDAGNRVVGVQQLFLDYIAAPESRGELSKAALYPSWLYLLGKLFKVSFLTMMQSLTPASSGVS